MLASASVPRKSLRIPGRVDSVGDVAVRACMNPVSFASNIGKAESPRLRSSPHKLLRQFVGRWKQRRELTSSGTRLITSEGTIVLPAIVSHPQDDHVSTNASICGTRSFIVNGFVTTESIPASIAAAICSLRAFAVIAITGT